MRPIRSPSASRCRLSHGGIIDFHCCLETEPVAYVAVMSSSYWRAKRPHTDLIGRGAHFEVDAVCRLQGTTGTCCVAMDYALSCSQRRSHEPTVVPSKRRAWRTQAYRNNGFDIAKYVL
jgi:hypothetical protein